MGPRKGGSARPPSKKSLVPVQKKQFSPVLDERLRPLIVREVYKYDGNKEQLAEACAGIVNLMKAEKSSLWNFFYNFIATALYQSGHKSCDLPKFGHVLAYSLLKEKESGRDEIIKSIAEYCRGIVGNWRELSQTFGYILHTWDIIAEVLSNAIRPTPDLIQLEGAPLDLEDFEVVFDAADMDGQNPNPLLIKVNEKVETLKKQQRQKQLTTRIVREVLKYALDKDKLDEACAGILDLINSKALFFNKGEKALKNPSYLALFQVFMVTVNDWCSRRRSSIPSFGHVLARCLHKIVEKIGIKGRNRILKEIANLCGGAENYGIVREVLSNAILPPNGQRGAPTVEDFKGVFVNAFGKANKRNRYARPYALFVQVLKLVTEIDDKGDKRGVKVDCEWIINNLYEDAIMDMDKFIEELKDTTTNFGCNLYDILAKSNCLDTTSSLSLLFDSFGRTLEMLSSGDLADEYRLKRMKMRIVREVNKYHSDKNNLDEACYGILNMHVVFSVVTADWFERPSLTLLFQVFFAAAEDEAQYSKDSEHILSLFGHVLDRCLLIIDDMIGRNKGGRYRIIKSIVKLCGDVIEYSDEERVASFCNVIGKVLSSAIIPTPDLSMETPLTVEDFKEAFFKTANDTQKPYSLFVQVLKGLVETQAKRTPYREMPSFGANVNCKSIIKKMNGNKLIEELKSTPIFHSNLYEILRECSCPNMTSSLYHFFDYHCQVSVSSFFRLFYDCY